MTNPCFIYRQNLIGEIQNNVKGFAYYTYNPKTDTTTIKIEYKRFNLVFTFKLHNTTYHVLNGSDKQIFINRIRKYIERVVRKFI